MPRPKTTVTPSAAAEDESKTVGFVEAPHGYGLVPASLVEWIRFHTQQDKMDKGRAQTTGNHVHGAIQKKEVDRILEKKLRNS